MIGITDFTNANTRDEQEAYAQEAWQMSAESAVNKVEGLEPSMLLKAA
jgi:hypothetical protein